MKKLGKKIGITLAVLIVVIAGAGYYGFSQLDRIVRDAVEKYGTLAAQTEVKLDHVSLSLTSGEGSLGGLSVANPKGFSANKAFDLGSVVVKLDTGSIRGSGPIVIKSIDIEKPRVAFELNNDGSTNLQTLQRNVQSYAGTSAGSGKTDTAPSGGPARKLVIDDLVINNGQIAISQESLGGKQLSIPLPTIHLTGIGKGSGGVSAGQLAEQIINSISSTAAQASITSLAKDKISGVLKAVPGSAIGGAAVNQIGTSVKGLLGN